MALSPNVRCGSWTSVASAASTVLPSHCSLSGFSAARCQLGSRNPLHSLTAIGLSTTSRQVLPIRRRRRQLESTNQHRLSTISAAANDLATSAKNTKVSPVKVKDAKIVAQPPQDNQLKIRVDVDGEATKRSFDTVLKDLAKHAPPVPGFRKAKGGKTSNVPLNVIYQLMGPKLVRKFVIQEIIKATLNEYVQKEGIKVKNELKTDQSSDTLDAQFEPGKEFGFDATLDLEDEQTQDSGKIEEVVDKIETQSQPLEAGV